MARCEVYVDLDGHEIALATLDNEERTLLARLQKRASRNPDWCDFGNFWFTTVAAFYDARGMPRKRSSQTAVYRIAQDLCSRLGIAAGMIAPPDYVDELAELIRTRFKTRRAFCKATGLSEDMLSHVLSGRKHLSLSTLTTALERIGYRLQITPAPRKQLTG